ncbi:MAG TPA: DUF4189 domain-containing protein [Mycobacterium sp.]|nr:DUF4189 domain-containing protein [Mycobacterium sp.]
MHQDTAFFTKAIVGVATLAAGIGFMPVANAATDGTTWAAVAYSPTSGKSHTVWNRSSEIEADNDAVRMCNQDGNSTDCQIAADGNYCVALATDSNWAHFSGGHGTTIQAADAVAMQGLPDGTIQDSQCNT